MILESNRSYQTRLWKVWKVENRVGWYIDLVVSIGLDHSWKKIYVGEYATADILISMLRKARISLACSSTDRRRKKKHNSPHRRCEIKTGTRALKLSPYWREIPIAPTLTYVKVQPVRGYTCCALLFFYLQFSWWGTSAFTIQRRINLYTWRYKRSIKIARETRTRPYFWLLLYFSG